MSGYSTQLCVQHTANPAVISGHLTDLMCNSNSVPALGRVLRVLTARSRSGSTVQEGGTHCSVNSQLGVMNDLEGCNQRFLPPRLWVNRTVGNIWRKSRVWKLHQLYFTTATGCDWNSSEMTKCPSFVSKCLLLSQKTVTSRPGATKRGKFPVRETVSPVLAS